MTRDEALQIIKARFPALLIDPSDTSPPNCIVVRQVDDGYPFCINLPAGGPNDAWQLNQSLSAVQSQYGL